jgi:hypothetical protein
MILKTKHAKKKRSISLHFHRLTNVDDHFRDGATSRQLLNRIRFQRLNEHIDREEIAHRRRLAPLCQRRRLLHRRRLCATSSRRSFLRRRPRFRSHLLNKAVLVILPELFDRVYFFLIKFFCRRCFFFRNKRLRRSSLKLLLLLRSGVVDANRSVAYHRAVLLGGLVDGVRVGKLDEAAALEFAVAFDPTNAGDLAALAKQTANLVLGHRLRQTADEHRFAAGRLLRQRLFASRLAASTTSAASTRTAAARTASATLTRR